LGFKGAAAARAEGAVKAPTMIVDVEEEDTSTRKGLRKNQRKKL
jgi:hypothetical protein